MGRHDEAVAEIEIAVKLDPLSADTHATAGWAYSFAGEFDREIDESQRALQIDPAIVHAQAHLVDGYMEKGMYDQAMAEFETYAIKRDFSPESVAAIKDAYRKSGIKGFWQELIDLNAQKRTPPALGSTFLATGYAVLGDKAKALEYLEKAYAERDSDMEFLNAIPEFRSLRFEPRFQELVRKVGLPPELTH
jgi:tetratricopeptide (TPR) repeat protein